MFHIGLCIGFHQLRIIEISPYCNEVVFIGGYSGLYFLWFIEIGIYIHFFDDFFQYIERVLSIVDGKVGWKAEVMSLYSKYPCKY